MATRHFHATVTDLAFATYSAAMPTTYIPSHLHTFPYGRLRYTSALLFTAPATMPLAFRSRTPVAAFLLALGLPLTAHAFDPLATRSELPLLATPPAGATPAWLAELTDQGAVACPTALAERPLSLAEVVDAALCRYPQTREVWAAARAQAAQLGAARGAWLPTVNASAGSSRQKFGGDTAASRASTEQTTRSSSLTLSWLLYDGGARSANVESARQLLLAAGGTRDATVQAVFLNALQAYFQAQAGEQALTAAQAAEKAAAESLAAASKRYEVGTATPADKLQAQTAYAQAQLTRIQAEGQRRNALGALAVIVGEPAGRNVQPLPASADDLKAVPPQLDPAAIDALLARAQELRPDLRAAEAQWRAAQAGVEAARAAHLPTLSLGAGPSRQSVDGLSSTSNTLGLTLNIPLFAGFATEYKVQAAQATAEQRQAAFERTKLQVSLDVWQGYQNLVTASQSLTSTATLLASADQSAKVALGRYQAGVGSILDTLNAQSALAAARQQRVQAQLNWNVARATLAQAVGSLDHRLLTDDAALPTALTSARSGTGAN